MYNVDEYVYLYISIKFGGICYEYNIDNMDRIVLYSIFFFFDRFS